MLLQISAGIDRCGVFADFEGSLLIDGEPVSFQDTREAQDAGIAMIHQELMPVPDLTVAGISAGVASGLISSARPAGDIVRDIVREAETLLRERPQALMDR